MEIIDSKDAINSSNPKLHRKSEQTEHSRISSYTGIRRFSAPNQSHTRTRTRSSPGLSNSILTTKTAQYDIINHYIVLNTIGQGSFGKVIQVLSTIDHKHYACKVISRKIMKRFEFYNPRITFANEVTILKAIEHPRITKLYDVLDDPKADSIYLVFELCKGPIMHIESQTSTTPLHPSECLRVFGQMLDAVSFLHNSRIIHCDIKPDNILVCFDGDIKLSDFGMSVCVPFGKQLIIDSPKETTPAFTPPEVRQLKRIDGTKIDIFALGVTLYCLFHGHLPWNADCIPDLYEQVNNFEPSYPPITSSYHLILKELLYKDPSKRTTISNISKHPQVYPYLVSPISKSSKLTDLFKKAFR
eukprot:NODE_18_length_40692_cov_0.469183.p9 type:complete len:358 gc:universal NODE_18_length_40692_cov_0.469183:5685-4612(-)